MSGSVSADDRLTVSGNIENIVTGLSNYSAFDNNFTKLDLGGDDDLIPMAGDADERFTGVTRMGFRFTVEALENTQLVLDTLSDHFWGISETGWMNSDRAGTFAPGGYHSGGIRTNAFWFRGLIPGTGATLTVGAPYFGAVRLKGCIINCINTAGATLAVPFSDTVNTYTWYSRQSDSWGGVTGNYRADHHSHTEKTDEQVMQTAPADGDAGDTWAIGTRIELAPMEGLDLDLLYAFQNLECRPDCDTHYKPVRMPHNETRHWVGADMRYVYGDMTLSPTLILLFGESELKDGGNADIASFLFDLEVAYQVGPLGLKARIAYTPGNPASDDLGAGSTYKSWQTAGVWNNQASVPWFQLWGSGCCASHTHITPDMFGYGTPRSIRHNLSFDQFGLMHVAVQGTYTVNERTGLVVALGIFNAAEEVGRPARMAAAAAGATDSYNYTGQDTHLATEVDVQLKYQLYSNTELELWAAYAMTGDALNLIDAKGELAEAQNTTGAGARLNYSF